MSKQRIRLDISYDGTNYAGWQVQPGHKTVQGEIEKALEGLLGEQLRIHGSGRTDSGVHANLQVAHFDIASLNIPIDRLKYAVNSQLDRDIRIIASQIVGQDFHSRYAAKIREYKYYLNVDDFCHPKDRLYSWHIGYTPDLDVLNKFSSHLLGDKDYTAFSSIKDASQVKIRRIYSASFYFEGNMLVFKIRGNAFLWKMIRAIVGTFIMMERKAYDIDYLEKMFETGDRSMAGTIAPAAGLFLHKVFYDGELLNYYERF